MLSQWVPNNEAFEYVLKLFVDVGLKWGKAARGRDDGDSFAKEDIRKSLAFACPQCSERGSSWMQVKDETTQEVDAHFKVGTEIH
jgi:hypothetical protein